MAEVVENFFPPTEEVEPWRCCSCRDLMYNTQLVDGQVCPAPGAPSAVYYSEALPRLCKVCYEMLSVVKASKYFTQLDLDVQAAAKRSSSSQY